MTLVDGTRTDWFDTEDESEVHRRLNAACDAIVARQSYRADSFLHYARLYAGSKIDGLEIGKYAVPSNGGPMRSDVVYNVVKNLSDTLTSKIAKSQPLPMFLTSGGKWATQRKAKALTKFVEGVFDECKVFEITTATCLDATVHGPGFVHVYEDGKRIRVEKVRPWELFVDDAEACSGDPRCLYRQRWENRRLLKATYPEKKEEIDAAATDCTGGHDHDLMQVREAWRLPTDEESGDGLYVVCIDGAALSVETWERSYFPFPKLTMTPPQIGWYGSGLGDLLSEIQFEVNFTAFRIRQAHKMMGGSHWVVMGGSIEAKMLDNGMGTVWNCTGASPQPLTPIPIHPDAYRYLEMLRSYASEVSGVSQLSATSQKPAGLNSGKALDTYSDIESERFYVFGKQWERFHLEISRQIIDCARDLVAKGVKYEVQAKTSRAALKRLQFKDADLAQADYAMEVYPTSAFSRTPAARMAEVRELFVDGVISADRYKRLLNFPDLEEDESLWSSSYDLASEHIERMLDDGEVADPIPEMNIEEAFTLVQLSIARATLRECPDSHIALARRYASILQSWMPQAPADPNAMPPDGAAMPSEIAA